MATQREICEEKVRYVTKGAAVQSRNTLRSWKPDIRFFAYYCDLCRGFHLSKTTKRW